MASYLQAELAIFELSCPVCFEEYDIQDAQRTPKLLLCLHTFCLECIRKVSRPDMSLECPMCRMLHRNVSSDYLFDNLVILQHLRQECELRDLELAQQMDKDMRNQQGAPPTPPVRVRERRSTTRRSSTQEQLPVPLEGDGLTAGVEDRRNERVEDLEDTVNFASDSPINENEEEERDLFADFLDDLNETAHEHDESFGDLELSALYEPRASQDAVAGSPVNSPVSEQEDSPAVTESDGSGNEVNGVDQDGSNSEGNEELMLDESGSEVSEVVHHRPNFQELRNAASSQQINPVAVALRSIPDLSFRMSVPRIHIPFPILAGNSPDGSAENSTVVIDDSDSEIESPEFGACVRVSFSGEDSNSLTCEGYHDSSDSGNSDQLPGTIDDERESDDEVSMEGDAQQTIVLDDDDADADDEGDDEEDHFHTASEDISCFPVNLTTYSIETDDEAQNGSVWDAIC